MVSNPSIWSDQHSSRNQTNTFSDPNKHRFNHYADKQLFHLVVAEEFDFNKIASILSTILPIKIISSANKELSLPRPLAGRGGKSYTF